MSVTGLLKMLVWKWLLLIVIQIYNSVFSREPYIGFLH